MHTSAAMNPKPPSGIQATTKASTDIATPATGTQPSSMRRRNKNAASPKPPIMPSEAAPMNSEDKVPKPPWPPVMTLASFTDHRLMKVAKPQKNAMPKDARRNGASRHRSLRWPKCWTSIPARKGTPPCAGTRGTTHAISSAGTEHSVRINIGSSAAVHATDSVPPSPR